jgi:hypothetical protein
LPTFEVAVQNKEEEEEIQFPSLQPEIFSVNKRGVSPYVEPCCGLGTKCLPKRLM